MNKLAVVALLGMLAVAAAVDAEVQKKHYKKEKYDDKKYDDKKEYTKYDDKKEEYTKYDDKEEKYEETYKKDKDYKPDPKVVYKPYYPPPSKANVEAKHKEWDLFETVIKTHPCDQQYEILGSTVAQSASLSTDGKSAGVGKVFWSGIVVAHDRCDHCKEYVAKTEHAVDVNYQVIFEFTAEHKGQIITSAVAPSIFSDESVTLAVTGGSGAFEGAWGTVTWTYGEPNGKYSFDIYIPKVHDLKDKDYPKEDKEEKYFV